MSLKIKGASSQLLIDPASPAGGGGTGYFRQPLISLTPRQTTPYPKGLYSLQWLATSDTPAHTANTKINLPPETVVKTHILLKKKNSTTAINIKVKVLADNTDNSLDENIAKTKIKIKNIVYKFHEHVFDDKGDKKIITKLKGKFIFNSTITIRTSYSKKSTAKDKALYGRGTTEDDIKNGDVTLGFHESIHQKKSLHFLKNKTIPALNVKIGMSLEEYKKSIAKFEKEFKTYQQDILDFKDTPTDEVGYKLSQCIEDGKC